MKSVKYENVKTFSLSKSFSCSVRLNVCECKVACHFVGLKENALK